MKTLAEYRNEKKLTQRELSEQTGIPVSSIAMYEIGERQPSLKRAKILAAFFKIRTDDIIFGKKHHDERARPAKETNKSA